MIIEPHIVTLAASAVQFPAPTATSSFGLVRKITVEPLRGATTHASFLGVSNVTNDGSGTGVIKEIATAPASTVILDFFADEHQLSLNGFDPTIYYAHGTTGDKLKVTYFIA